MELRVSPRLLNRLADMALLKISEFNPQVCKIDHAVQLGSSAVSSECADRQS
jgi:hypothetical protein